VRTPATALRLALAAALIAGCGGGGSDEAATTTAGPHGTTTTAGAPASSPLADPAAVLRAYVDAFNRSDVDGAILEFAPDATFFTSVGGCAPCTGRAEIRATLASAASSHTQIAVTNAQTNGDTVTADALFTAPNLPPGIGTAAGTVNAVVRGRKIVRLTMTYAAGASPSG
jgi:hypothetical protein